MVYSTRDAIGIARKYYDDETFYHAMRVTAYVSNNNLIPNEIKEECCIAAIMHDLIEDTDFKLDDSYNGTVLKDILILLTRNKNDTYEEYLRKIKKSFNNRPEAYWVKMADMKDHLEQTETLTKELKEKYFSSISCLL